MISLSNVIERVQKLVRSDHIDTDQLRAIIQTRYELLYETMPTPTKRREFMISLVAQVASGSGDTVSVNNASSTVTSAGTPFTSAMTGRQMVISGEVTPFFITYSSTSVVTLQDGEGNAATWAASNTSGASWRIFKTLYDLPSDCDDLLHIGLDYPLIEIDGGRDTLNRLDPNRESTSSEPTNWCYSGTAQLSATSTVPTRQIEIWPVPTSARMLRGEYLRRAPILTQQSIIDLPAPLIVYGSTADAFGALFSLTGDQAYSQANIFWERKTTEIMNDYGPRMQQRQSFPRTFGRGGRAGPQGDYLVDHLPLEEYPR